MPETKKPAELICIMDITMELNTKVIHQLQIIGHQWVAGNPPLKKYRIRNYGGNRLWVKGEEEKIHGIIPYKGSWSHKPVKDEIFICICTIMGYGRRWRNKFYRLEGSLRVPGPCSSQLFISQFFGCVTGGGNTPKFVCITESDTQWHHKGQQ